MSLASYVFHRVFLSCQEATHLLSHAQDAPLGFWRRWRLDVHLRACAACRRFDRQLAALRAAMRRYRE
jgi:hypothetical protein